MDVTREEKKTQVVGPGSNDKTILTPTIISQNTRPPVIAGIETTAQTMSSLEIAELTGKRHPDVKRDIENILAQAEIDVSKFAHIYFDLFKNVLGIA